jgi:hypothetical protein
MYTTTLQVHAHVNDSTKFTAYSQAALDKFNFTLGWLKEWACTRYNGYIQSVEQAYTLAEKAIVFTLAIDISVLLQAYC